MLIQSDFSMSPLEDEITQHLRYHMKQVVHPKEVEFWCSKKNFFNPPNFEPNITKNMAVF